MHKVPVKTFDERQIGRSRQLRRHRFRFFCHLVRPYPLAIQAPPLRRTQFAFATFLTCNVEMTSRTPSVSIATRIALPMSSGDETEPDKVTTPLVVLTDMLIADKSRLAKSFPLIAVVVRASAVLSTRARPTSRA